MGQDPPAGQLGKTGRPALVAGRYFKYAIGEIVLVVIGILIALQLNDWNDSRKQLKLENEYKISSRQLAASQIRQMIRTLEVRFNLNDLEAELQDIHMKRGQ